MAQSTGSDGSSGSRTRSGNASNTRRRPVNTYNTGRNSTGKTRDRNRPVEVNLVAARSGEFTDSASLSRDLSRDRYATTRSKSRVKKILRTALTVLLICSSLSIATAFGVYKLVIEPGLDKDISTDVYGRTFTSDDFKEMGFVVPENLKDPFFMLLLGVDDYKVNDYARSDTIILVYLHPAARKVALISIPRDIRVSLPGAGTMKINEVYGNGEASGKTGVAMVKQEVEKFAGVQISYFAEIRFNKFYDLVNALGGVYVDVPFRIDDPEAGNAVLEQGPQILDGEGALTFVRSRNSSVIGDYQRQANQRIFLQAMAKQILSGSPTEISNAVSCITDAIYSNLKMNDIVDLALSFKGVNESDIHTYTVPSDWEVDHTKVFTDQWNGLMAEIKAGNMPNPQDFELYWDTLGVAPESYRTGGTPVGRGILSAEECSQFTIDVRNGCGINGCAKAVSDLLAIEGYRQGEIANTNNFVYQETLIIYNSAANLPIATDIQMRLGYGRTVNSQGYTFSGDILVVVGKDFPDYDD